MQTENPSGTDFEDKAKEFLETYTYERLPDLLYPLKGKKSKWRKKKKVKAIGGLIY